MARATALAAAIAVSLLAVSGAGGAGAQTPKRGGTVVFGPISEPRCLSPFLASRCGEGIPSFFWIMETVLPGAFRMAPDFTPRPELVSRARFTKAPPFTLTYSIRPAARWSDGVPVSAADFVFTHRALLRTGDQDPDLNPHRLVTSISPVNAKTVRMVLRKRVASWRLVFFPFVAPRHALAGQDLERIWLDGVENPRTGSAIGSGPFLVQQWDRGSRLTLVRNPRYWGPHMAHLDRLVVRFCQTCTAPPPAEVLARLQHGEVDVALSRDTGIVPDLRRIPGVGIVVLRSNGWEHLALRRGPGGHPALRDKRVRRAIAYGIDRAEIVAQLFDVIDTRYRPSHSAAFLNTSPYYSANWAKYGYRPNLARRLLEQAGCRRGADRIYSCDGARVSLRFLTIAGTRLREREIELMQSQLRQIGIEVVPEFATRAIFDQILPGGAFDVASFSWFVGDAIGDKGVFGCGGPQNFTGYCQRLVTEDLDQAERILSASQRARVLNRVDRRLANDVPVIPLYQIPFVLAIKSSVRGVVASPNNLLWNAENWWLER